MLVVADTSPFVVLANINQTGILPALFGVVLVPPQIIAELSKPERSQPTRQFLASRPPRLLERTPSRFQRIGKLDVGESAAIGLAMELKADLLLIDEERGRSVARIMASISPAPSACLSWPPRPNFLILRLRLPPSN